MMRASLVLKASSIVLVSNFIIYYHFYSSGDELRLFQCSKKFILNFEILLNELLSWCSQPIKAITFLLQRCLFSRVQMYE